ncbi:MAG: amidohydrolase [Acidimicrobiales bacterium]
MPSPEDSAAARVRADDPQASGTEIPSETVVALKEQVTEEVLRRAGQLAEVSHLIHARPELGFEEHYAAGLLTQALADAGLEVTPGVGGLPTAFTATAGPIGGPAVGIMCEYDALPGLGHGCGHNVIAAAGLGAGLGAMVAAEALGGRLVVIGTPAEEGGGGKVALLEAGVFDGLVAALMVHPAAADLAEAQVVAISTFSATYAGRAAHAAAAPWDGRNALDAGVLGYMAVGALRQHIRSDERVHGIFTHGGDKPNIVPDRVVAEWYVRAPTATGAGVLRERVVAALAGCAAAAGCTMEIAPLGPDYTELVSNQPLLDCYRANSAALGRPVADPTPQSRLVASTDAGNVSLAVPTIHPMVKVAPAGVALHSESFARAAISAEADQAIVEAAGAMAMTAVDIWASGQLRAAVSQAHG